MASHLSLFGHIRLSVDERQYLFGETTASVLLAFLGLHASYGRMMPRSAIVAQLWPDVSSERGNAYLSNALYRLKSALGPDAALITANNNALGLQVYAVDVAEFRQFACSTRFEDWQHALDVYHDDLLIDLDADWIVLPRATLQLAYLDLLMKTCTTLAEAGQFTDALAYALRWALADPFNEDAHCVVMRLNARLGRHMQALRQYTSLVQLLDDELQVSPLQETVALAESIRAESIRLRSVRPSIAFVGRQREYGTLIGSLERAMAGYGHLVMLTGVAGSGKTRLLSALTNSAAWRGIRIFSGTTPTTQHSDMYHPLATALRQAYSSPIGVELVEHLSERAAQLHRLIMAPAHLAARSIGSDQRTDLDSQAGYADLLALVSESTPCVFLLDQLEQTVPTFWPALIAATQALQGKRALIILAYRESVLRCMPHAWSSLCTLDANYAPLRLELGALGLDECTELSLSCRPDLAHAQITALYHETGGYPGLLIEQLHNRYAAGPDTNQGMLEAQIEHLEYELRQSLITLAVLGESFERGAALAVLGVQAAQHLDQLVRDRLLEERQNSYRFSLPTLQQVLVSQVSPSRREIVRQRVRLRLLRGASRVHDHPVVHVVRLARIDAPLGRQLTETERIPVHWTVDMGYADTLFAQRFGKVALRQQRIARLIVEAMEQGSLPTDAELSRVLAVTERTIRTDIACLRQSGLEIITRRRTPTTMQALA